MLTSDTKRFVLKLVAAVGLVVVGPILGAVYGALHDQISFTVAPEYYTHFKFIQFAWAGVAEMTPRIGAATVGVLATWWVSLLAGIILSLVALIHHSPAQMLTNGLKAYGVVAMIALAAGAVGLAYGWIAGRNAASLTTWLPDGITSPRRFSAAGSMHNASYLGGAIGTLVAIGFHFRWRLTAIRRLRQNRIDSRVAAA